VACTNSKGLTIPKHSKCETWSYVGGTNGRWQNNCQKAVETSTLRVRGIGEQRREQEGIICFHVIRGILPKNSLKECVVFVNSALKIKCHVVKNILLQNAFSVIFPHWAVLYFYKLASVDTRTFLCISYICYLETNTDCILTEK